MAVGYAVILNDHSNSARLHDSEASTLVNTFPDADSAVSWVTHVVGEDIMTTYEGGEKSNQPGVGLYTIIQTQQQQIEPKLQALVNKSEPLTVENLQAISPPGLALTPAMIESIQQQSPVTQQILAAKLAQNIAALRVMDKARLAIQLLQTGRTIPEVYSNASAKARIHEAIQQLQQEVNDMLLFIKARELLMTRTLSTIVQAGNAIQRKQSAMSSPDVSTPFMTEGAVKTENSSH